MSKLLKVFVIGVTCVAIGGTSIILTKTLHKKNSKRSFELSSSNKPTPTVTISSNKEIISPSS